MSKIVTPYPPTPFNPLRLPATARWWRLELPPRPDGTTLWFESNATGDDLSTATWMSIEFFDGHDTILDAGLDRLTPVRLSSPGIGRHVLDVLHVDAPTPAAGWVPLTRQGVLAHPDDRSGA